MTYRYPIESPTEEYLLRAGQEIPVDGHGRGALMKSIRKVPVPQQWRLLHALSIAVLWRDRNRYNFHDSPYDVEHRRNDNANKEQDERVVQYPLHDGDSFRWLYARSFFTHSRSFLFVCVSLFKLELPGNHPRFWQIAESARKPSFACATLALPKRRLY